MKLKEAISRLRFTISKQTKPNQTDTEAFNSVLSHLQKTETETVQDNLLFAKLYAYVLGNLAAHYTDVDAANKRLNEILSQPMHAHIQMLEMQLKAMATRQIFLDPFLKEQSPDQVKATMEKYKQFEKEFATAWDYWDEDNVTANLNRNINLSLQNFKNNV